MNNQSPRFAEMANEFIDTLSPAQVASFRGLLEQLQRDAQQHLSSLSRSTSEAFTLLDQITQVNA